MERKIPKKCISLKQAADMTGLKPKTIQNKVYAGILTRYGTRGKITVDIEEVQAKLMFGFLETDENNKSA